MSTENIFTKICSMLKSCSDDETSLPPALTLYNEGWMLNLILDWFATHPTEKDSTKELSFCIPGGAKWYSESLLPTAFRARQKKDKLAEKETHADGAIGNIYITEGTRRGLSLEQNASHFVVTEAKMFSGLSKGVTNAPYYNQAARTVACIAEVLYRAEINPKKMGSLGFYVFAPESQIDNETFEDYVTKDSIKENVEERANAYEGSKDDWLEKWFTPTMKKIEIGIISWEELIDFIKDNDKPFGEEILKFYSLCKEFNSP